MGSARSGTVVAVDLGATSGRVVAGVVGAGVLDMTTVSRFPNRLVEGPDGLHWDSMRLFEHAVDGLRLALGQDPDIASVAFDAWGVDYGLVADGRLLGYPFHYRDFRTAESADRVHRIVDPATLFARTGVRPLAMNTLYQLAAEPPEVLGLADAALLTPDLFAFWFAGVACAELSIASTTGMLRHDATGWDTELVEMIGIPTGLLAPLVSAGTEIGAPTARMARSLGDPRRLRVTAVGAHDTASAVCATPLDPETAAFISCGTWGLVGVELERPRLSSAAFDAGFTNEVGVDGRILLQRNGMGLWLLAESLRQWEREDGRSPDLGALLAAAGAVRGPVPRIDVEDAVFAAPGDIPGRIRAWCATRGLASPGSRAETVRCIVDSLAAGFADAVRAAQALSGVAISRVHLVGGGALNRLLCQRVADEAGLPVHAGPVEATALGSVLIQARATGFLSGTLEALRGLVRATQQVEVYRPRASTARR